MVSKMGRPKSGNPQSQRFSIRLDDKIGERLDAYCASANEKRSSVIRKAIVQFLDEQTK